MNDGGDSPAKSAQDGTLPAAVQDALSMPTTGQPVFSSLDADTWPRSRVLAALRSQELAHPNNPAGYEDLWVTPTPVAPPAAAPVAASFGSRLAARLIDIAVLAIIAVAPVVVVLQLVIRRHTDVFSAAGGLLIALVALECVPVIAYAVYRIASDGGGGRSIGRAAVGIRLIVISPTATADPDRVGYWRASGRLVVSALTDALLFAGSLSMLWSPLRRTWADRAAGTTVVRDGNKRSGPGRALLVAILVTAVITALTAINGVRERHAADRKLAAATKKTGIAGGGSSPAQNLPSPGSDTNTSTSPGRPIGTVKVDQPGLVSHQVAASLSRYFSAINTRDYATAWRSLTAAEQDQSGGFASFAHDMSTTSNSALEVRRAVVNKDRTVDAEVTFTSHQDGKFGPQPGETCSDWMVTYRLAAGSAHQYLIDGIQSSADNAC